VKIKSLKKRDLEIGIGGKIKEIIGIKSKARYSKNFDERTREDGKFFMVRRNKHGHISVNSVKEDRNLVMKVYGISLFYQVVTLYN
jgi:hypothetical protein